MLFSILHFHFVLQDVWCDMVLLIGNCTINYIVAYKMLLTDMRRLIRVDGKKEVNMKRG